MEQLSDNFSLQELTLSETAVRRGIPNEPSEAVIANLKLLCEHILEPLRLLVGKPILITSGYRSPMLNQAIGGARNSQHCTGNAVDFHINGYTVEQLYQFVKKSVLPYSQTIQEFNRWVHVSYDGSVRHESLRATKNEEGATQYFYD